MKIAMFATVVPAVYGVFYIGWRTGWYRIDTSDIENRRVLVVGSDWQRAAKCDWRLASGQEVVVIGSQPIFRCNQMNWTLAEEVSAEVAGGCRVDKSLRAEGIEECVVVAATFDAEITLR